MKLRVAGSFKTRNVDSGWFHCEPSIFLDRNTIDSRPKRNGMSSSTIFCGRFEFCAPKNHLFGEQK